MNTFLSEWTKLVSTKAIYWTTGLFLFFGVGFAAVYGLDVPADPMVKLWTGMDIRIIKATSVVAAVAALSFFVTIVQATKVVMAKWFLYSIFIAILTFVTVLASLYMTKRVSGELSSTLPVWSDEGAIHVLWGYPVAAVLLVTFTQGVSWLLRQTAGAISIMGLWFFALENLLGLLPKVGKYIVKYGPINNFNAFLTKTSIDDIQWDYNGSIAYFGAWAVVIFIAGAIVVRQRDA